MMDNIKYYLEKFLAVILLILLFLFFLYCRFIKEKEVLKEALFRGQQDSTRVADSLKKIEIETKAVEKIYQDSIGKSNKEELPVFVRDIRDTYYIIIGSFVNPENAKLAVGKYRSLGYKISIISTTNRNGTKAELVSVKTFSNFDDAVRYLRDFQNKVDSKAWIYPNH